MESILPSVVILITCLKVLFFAAYRSTDFEVHRNWLAVTYSLPLKEWYVDKTSEWTLDYPPLFAWFEYLLANVAAYVDPKMLDVTNLNYASRATIIFQRSSVIAADMVLVYGANECSKYIKAHRFRKCSKWRSKWNAPSAIFLVIVLGNFGLILVDHIHFQYNGLLFGILLLSIVNILKENYLTGAFWFTVLLNMKHIFLYMAPVYAVYLLKNYCFKFNGRAKSVLAFSYPKLVKLGAAVLGVFIFSFGPFILMGQLPEVLGRLFPFKRGLCHAYWAPNFWTLYNVVDMTSAIMGEKIGILDGIKTNRSMTKGLVQEFKHIVLPTVTPLATFLMTILAAVPCLWKLWNGPGNPLHFVRSLVICSSCAFIFGWHVHEKAIMMTIIPFSLTAVLWRKEAEIFAFLVTVGNYSLLPLIFTASEEPIKILLFMLFSNYTLTSFSDLFGIKYHFGLLPILPALELIYLLGFVPLYFYHTFLHKILDLGVVYPFLPLLLTSLYCSIGIFYSFFKYYYHFLFMDDRKQKMF